MFELEPRIKKTLSRMNDPNADKAERAFQKVRDDILLRDDMTCQACGFRSVSSEQRPSGYMEVHHIDDNHHNNKKSNLITLCPLCHSVFTLGKRGDKICGEIGFTTVSQANINRVAHMLMGLSWKMRERVEEDDFSEFKMLHSRLNDVYTRTFENAKDRGRKIAQDLFKINAISEKAEKFVSFDKDSFIEKMFSVKEFYETLRAMDMATYKNRGVLTKYMRIFPDLSAYSEEAGYWGKHVWKPLEIEDIENLAKERIANIVEGVK